MFFLLLASCALKTGGLGTNAMQDVGTDDGDRADQAADAPEDVPEEPTPDTPVDIQADQPADDPEDLSEEPTPDTPVDILADEPADTPEDLPEEPTPDTPVDILADLPEEAPEEIPEEPSPECGPEGTLLWGICWYLGDLGQNCHDVCFLRGEYHEDTPEYVGTTSQGGSHEECDAIFDALGYTRTVSPGYRDDGLGLGCHRWSDGGLWWLERPDFDPSDSTGGGQLVCGCNE